MAASQQTLVGIGKAIEPPLTPFVGSLFELLKLGENTQINEKDILPDDIAPAPDAEVTHIDAQILEANNILDKGDEVSVEEKLKALKTFKRAAKLGSPNGLYHLALMYSNGLAGLTEDPRKAVELCREAAAQKPYVRNGKTVCHNLGVYLAEHHIAMAYQDGRGVNQDDKLAFEWFLRAATHGSRSSQARLGTCFFEGKGCDKNLELARHWYEKAAASAFFLSEEDQFNFFTMLTEGQGGPVDVTRAGILLEAAAKQGMSWVLRPLQDFLSSKRVEEKALKEDKDALFHRVVCHLVGFAGFEKNIVEAEAYARAAADLGHSEANLVLGDILLKQCRNKEAIEVFWKSVDGERGIEALFTLGILFAMGQGCKPDVKQARQLLTDAAKYDPEVRVDKILEQLAKVAAHEKQNNYSIDGMTYQDRVDRFMAESDEFGVANDDRRKVASLLKLGTDSFESSLADDTVITFPQMRACANRGSKTAKRFFDALDMLKQAVDCLTEGAFTEAFRLHREAYKAWDLLPVDPITSSLFHSAAKEVFSRNPKDASALLVILRCEMLNGNTLDEQVSMAKKVVQLDPSVGDYHHVLACLYLFKYDIDNAQRCIAKALEIERNPEWLYEKASCLRLKDDYDPAEAIKAYEEYIDANEEDNRKIPDAYYCVAICLVDLKDRKKAEEYLKKAERAENPPVRLPCFGPVEDDFLPKYCLRLLLKAEKLEMASPGASGRQPLPDQVGNCGLCGKGGVTSRCSKCKKVGYCDRDCQRKHWKVHKKNCS